MTITDIKQLLLGLLPPGYTRWYDFSSGSDGDKILTAAAEQFALRISNNVDAVDANNNPWTLVDNYDTAWSASIAYNPYTVITYLGITYVCFASVGPIATTPLLGTDHWAVWQWEAAGIESWEEALALLPGNLSVTQRKAAIISKLREHGASTLANVRALVGPLLGYVDPTLLTLVECPRADLTTAHTYADATGGSVVGAGSFSLTCYVPDDALVSAGGALLRVYLLDPPELAQLSAVLYDPTGAVAATFPRGSFGSGTIAGVGGVYLLAQGAATHPIMGTWTLTITNSAAGTFVSPGWTIFVEGIGRDSVGGDGLGCEIFKFAALVDPTLTVAPNYPATLRALARVRPAHTQSYYALPMANQRFYNPLGITSDGTNLYIVDRENYTIRKMVIATGIITTLAGTAGIAGSTDGTGAAASFNEPSGITSDGTNLYVTDRGNCTIRKIVIATGVVTTLAGAALDYGYDDGTGTAAKFYFPEGIRRDGANLFVADSLAHTIRQIVIATGVVTTLAGTGGATGSTDDTGALARFNEPMGIISIGANLYVTDAMNNTIRKIVSATGVVTTIAGTAGAQGSTDDVGADARFYYPAGITSDGIVLYVVDNGNQTIRKIVTASATVSTLAGTAGVIGSTDGIGAAASFYSPHWITYAYGNLYITDTQNQTVRSLVIASADVTTIAGVVGSSGSTVVYTNYAICDNPNCVADQCICGT